jgi:hypothetical protein
MAPRSKPPHMWDGAWEFSCEAVSKDNPFTQSNDFAAAAYLSGALGEPEPDMDFEDDATREAGIEALRTANGRIALWSPNFDDENDRRFLAYLVKGGKFGGKEDLEVNSPTAGTEAIRHIHNWYLTKHHASWMQFRNWLKKNDPENEGAAPENKADEENMEIKKEDKTPLPSKQPQSTQKGSPGGAGEAETPTKSSKPQTPKTPEAANIQTPPKTNKTPKDRPKPTPAILETPTKTNHPAAKTSSKKSVKKSDLPSAAIQKQRRGGMSNFTKKLMRAGLGESKEAKMIQFWLNKLSLKENHKSEKGKEKQTNSVSDGDPGPSKDKGPDPFDEEMEIDERHEEQVEPQMEETNENDEAFQHRENSRQHFQRHDEAYGRFVLREAIQLTQQDIEYLHRGNNNLIELAQRHANLDEQQFLQAIFASDWNTAAGPTDRPVKAKRVAADAGVPCGVFTRDAYNKAQRKAMEKTGKGPGELRFKPLPDRRKGQTVYLKVFPSQLNTKSEFVCKKQRWCSDEDVVLEGGRVFGDYLLAALANYDERDTASCQRTNKEVLVWLARYRLYSWYTVQEAKPWNHQVAHYNIPEESIFEPMHPLRTTQQMFGSALSTNLRVAGGLAIDPSSNTPNGVRKSGAAEPVRIAADLRIHDREALALRKAMVNIDEEQTTRPRRPPVDIDAEEPGTSSDEDVEEDESEEGSAFKPESLDDSLSEDELAQS